MAADEVFLFLTDKQDAVTMSVFDRFSHATSSRGEPVLLFHQKTDLPPACIQNRNAFLFTKEDLVQLKYQPIALDLLPGSNHFPVLKFFIENPHYDHYWCIEDDVHFNGDWNQFFLFFQAFDHDFISTHLRSFRQEPQWGWWLTLKHSLKVIPLRKRIRSFNPIYRISAKALGFLHQALSTGWSGHHEVLIPTLLNYEGYRIADLGGSGKFVLKSNKNRFYTSSEVDPCGRLSEGTMRYRPLWTEVGNEKDMLYHPVKTMINNS